ncbi:OmpA family protein [Collimonas silvisoli]|uniref:OmpA family protein n=1 Tax=Collimonas silvisoli TaxID=2825884 RepID=UPI002E799E87|nr:OmpA family protein [Collimonas silvisoli]
MIGRSENQPIKTRELSNNRMLSQERAAKVATVLQAAGVALDSIEIFDHGNSLPWTSNATAAERAKNRRLEIVVAQGYAAAAATTSLSD